MLPKLPIMGQKLVVRMRRTIRARHYSRRTEQAYVAWVRRFVIFHGKRHPADMGAAEVVQYLTSLATEGRVSAATQNQASSALLFLYRDVLGRELLLPGRVLRAKVTRSLPVVLTREEVLVVCRQLHGVYRLIVLVLYGSGVRSLECLELRVKDVDLARREIRVRRGNDGARPSAPGRPPSLCEALPGRRRSCRHDPRDRSEGPGSPCRFCHPPAPRPVPG